MPITHRSVLTFSPMLPKRCIKCLVIITKVTEIAVILLRTPISHSHVTLCKCEKLQAEVSGANPPRHEPQSRRQSVHESQMFVFDFHLKSLQIVFTLCGDEKLAFCEVQVRIGTHR